MSRRRRKSTPKPPPRSAVGRILWNRRPVDGRDCGDIDEIVLHRPEFVHVEQMNDRDWWIGIAMPAGSEFSGHFHATSRGVMTFGLTESDIEWDKDDEHPEVGP